MKRYEDVTFSWKKSKNVKIVKNQGNIKMNGICVPVGAVWVTVTSGGNDNFATIVTLD